MSEIDWSKAPEGYPVWIQDITGATHDGSGWHREETVTVDDAPCERWVDVAGKFWPKDCEARGKIIVHRKPVEPWTGAGLPPVGAKGIHDSYNEVFTVFAVDGDWLAVSSEFTRFWTHSAQFKPVKTQEQIEAEGREKSRIAIREVLLSTHMPIGYVNEVAMAILNAGYRKQGEAK